MRRLVLATLLFSSTTFAANIAVLNFNRPATYADTSALPTTSILTYGIYQGEKGAIKVKVSTSNDTVLTISTGLFSGRAYCWQVTAIEDTNESDMSIEVCKTFPISKPVAPIGLTVQ